MDIDALLQAHELVWVYLAGPALAVAALAFTVRLRGVQLRRLGDAFRALGARGEVTESRPVPGGLATTLVAAGHLGAAAAVGTATAVSLGGPGVLPYLWAFALVAMPLRYAETWLARTDAPGGGDASMSGSLARRLMRSGPRYRLLGGLLALMVAATGFAWAGGTHGQAMAEAANRVLPGSGLSLVGATAAVGALLVLGGQRTAAITGWLGLVGILVLVASAIWAIAGDPGAAFASLGTGFSAAFDRAPRADEFTGALAGEIAFAALLWIGPMFGAGTGSLVGAAHSWSASATKKQVASALVEPLTLALVGTLLVMGFAPTFGARTAEATRLLPEVRALKLSVESPEQRADADRYFDQYLSIRDGAPVSPDVSFMTERGMIRNPTFELEGEAADIRLQFDEAGRAFRLLLPTMHEVRPESGLTGAVSLEERYDLLWEVRVHGEMLPRGADLVVASDDEVRPRVVLAALLALVAVLLAIWGVAIGRALPATSSPPLRMAAGILPAAGAALVGAGIFPELALLGPLFAGALAFVSALALVLRVAEVVKLDR